MNHYEAKQSQINRIDGGSGSLLFMQPSRPEVRGVNLDAQIRCAHYRTALDVIAIKMKCCGIYFACKECHEALAGHPVKVWPHAEWTEAAVLCGACGYEMTIEGYMASSYKCPHSVAAPRYGPSTRMFSSLESSM